MAFWDKVWRSVVLRLDKSGTSWGCQCCHCMRSLPRRLCQQFKQYCVIIAVTLSFSNHSPKHVQFGPKLFEVNVLEQSLPFSKHSTVLAECLGQCFKTWSFQLKVLAIVGKAMISQQTCADQPGNFTSAGNTWDGFPSQKWMVLISLGEL